MKEWSKRAREAREEGRPIHLIRSQKTMRTDDEGLERGKIETRCQGREA